ncbi:RNA-directed DNA polymerase, eukaryota [Tanacetum coccineum]|uniref:RNA-directed DNA polymerase, eukaryota n=1 Tax=Tanacetum coccineum TaxID=301880 RepID=A0ABQ4XFF3_9ASTR
MGKNVGRRAPRAVRGPLATVKLNACNQLGNGEDSRFWLDKWYEGGVLKRLFPRVYALELDKNISVSSKLKAPSLVTTFRRNARSGIEQTQFDSMAEIMKTISLVPRVDRYIWSLENDGSFSVASIRKTLDDNRFQEESLSTRWVKSVPIKVNILAWKVKSNALPTRFNISRRGMDIDSIDCYEKDFFMVECGVYGG